MTNLGKWLTMIVIGFGLGAISAASDDHASFGSYMRHGLIGTGPALIGLRTTLEKSDG